MTIFSEQYDFAISLLSLESHQRYAWEPQEESDTYDRFAASR